MNYEEKIGFWIKFKENTSVQNTVILDRYNIVIEQYVRIGKGTKIMRNVIIKEGVIIGENCIIGNGSLIRENVQLGDYVKIGFSNSIEPNAHIGDGTSTQGFCMISEFSEIGKNNFLGPYWNNPADKDCGVFEGEYKPNPASVGDNVRFGSNVKLKPGIHIGSKAFIWMNSLVTKNVPNGEMWGGSPAIKREKTKDGNGNKTLSNPLVDPEIQHEVKYGGG